jgi:hypothetical protein
LLSEHLCSAFPNTDDGALIPGCRPVASGTSLPTVHRDRKGSMS